MQIRPMEPRDAEQAFHLRVAAFSDAAWMEYDPAEQYVPDEHRMVAVEGDRVVGHLGVWPLHQAFLGRPVPMGGLAAVAVADDRRGSGVGSRLIAAGLEHMGDAGMAISSLYPSIPAPYRRWGWEFAGVHLQRRIATRDLLELPAPGDGIALRPYADVDLAAIVALHDAITRTEPGGLVAGERWQRRLLQPTPDRADIMTVATRHGRPVGLVLAAKSAPDDQRGAYALRVRRLFGVDRAVEQALWRCIGHHHPVAASTTFASRPAEPLLLELPHIIGPFGPRSEEFMTRLIDAPAAIAARGWPDVTVTVELEIADTRRAANSGRFVLEVDDRAAALTPGGSGRVTLDVGALSSMYTGFATPAQLAHAGRLTGATRDDLVHLTDAFTAPTPFMRDTY